MTEKRYQTYQGWRRAVRKLDPDAQFYGDGDIGGAISKAFLYAEWDGCEGVIDIDDNKGNTHGHD